VGKELRKSSDLIQALDEVFKELYSNNKLEKILENEIDQEISEKILQEAEFLCVDRLLE
jgi:ABC-type amino acid transport substrate-binding protein